MKLLPLAVAGDWWDWLTESSQRGEGQLRWHWAALPESWGAFVWLVLVAAMIAAVVWLYRRESGSCPPLARMIMAGLRAATLLLLLALLLRPSVYFQQVSLVRPVTVVLRDRSASMARGDESGPAGPAAALARLTGLDASAIAGGKVTRGDLVSRVLGSADSSVVRDLRERANVEVLDFDGTVEPAGTLPTILPSGAKPATEADAGTGAASSDEPSLRPLVCDGPVTDIASALTRALQGGGRVGSVVLVTEGQHNTSDDPRAVARRAAELGIPVFTVGVGDPSPRRNLSVEEVFVRGQAWPGESFEIESLLNASLPAGDPARGQPVSVRLIQQRLNDAGQPLDDGMVVQSRDVLLPASGSRLRVDFGHVIADPGSYRFIVEAAESGVETSLDDNRRTSAAMRIVDEQVKVLLISGLPNWEYIQLQRLLQRDPAISLSCWLQSMDDTRPQEGDLPITSLPRTLADLSQYNVVILIDPNPSEFDQAWINSLQEFCRNQAGGLMYMAGPQFTAEFLTMNRLAGMRQLLPVQFADPSEIAASQVIAEAGSHPAFQMQIVPHNLDHPVMSFHADRNENLARWQQFPGFAWHFPTAGAKPLARVLIEAGPAPNLESNHPVLVAGRYGAGNVLYFGYMGTWLWRSAGVQAQYFDRFWIQVVRHLVESRSLQGSRRGVIDSDATEYELGGKIALTARIRDEQFQPLVVESVPAIMQDAEGREQSITLQPVPLRPGEYAGTALASRTGSFRVRFGFASASDDGSLFDPAEFRVVPPRAEMAADWLDEALLREIASLSGGQYLPLERIGELPALLPRLETRAEFNGPSQPAWDFNRLARILVFLVPVLLLCSEWALRKWYRLL